MPSPQPGRLITRLQRVKQDQVTQNATAIKRQTLLSICYKVITILCFLLSAFWKQTFFFQLFHNTLFVDKGCFIIRLDWPPQESIPPLITNPSCFYYRRFYTVYLWIFQRHSNYVSVWQCVAQLSASPLNNHLC